MKKKILLLVFVTLSVIFLSLSVYAAPLDPQHQSSLTLEYRYQEEGCEGLTISTYRVADVLPEGNIFRLSGDFSDCPVAMNGVSSQTEWREIATTLAAYITSYGILPTETGITQGDGIVSFDNILPGVYLTLSAKAEKGNTTIVFETFLTVLPQPDENGELNYDVTAVPKWTSYSHTPAEIERKAVKLWKDSGYEGDRPESVTIDIYKDGVFFESQILSEENNWSYSWLCADDGTNWQVMEQTIPDDYTVTIAESGNTILITNAHSGDDPQAPQTGDTFVLWHYLLPMLLAGGGLLVLSVYRRKAE